MEEKERLKRVRKRREESRKRELEYDLNRDLAQEEKKKIFELNRDQYTNPIVRKMVIFLGTLFILYVLLFLVRYLFLRFFGPAVAMLNVDFGWVMPLAHGFIWVSAVYSGYRGRSVLEDWFEKF